MKDTARNSKTEIGSSADTVPQDVSTRRGWGPARHVADPAQVKLPTRRVTINLDEDIIAIFKAEALRGGPPYQVAINQALRAHLHEREVSEHERAVQTVLTALDDETVRQKLRSVR